MATVARLLSLRRPLKIYPRILSWGSPSVSALLKQSNNNYYQVVFYSTPQRKGFLSQIVENIKDDINKNKEMKENLKKFREEAEKFEQSEGLKRAKEKYKLIEKETSKGSEQLKEQLESIRGRIKEGLEEVQKSEIGKRGKEITDELTKSAKIAADAIAKQSEQLGKSTPLRAVAEGVKTVKEQIEEAQMSGPTVYQPPKKLHKRSDRSRFGREQKIVEPNSEATGIELHADSKWFQSWQNFRDNNAYVNKIFDLKVKYDESDNPVVRASRVFTEKVSDIFGGLFQKSEVSEVVTEIVKMDPTFDTEEFLKECEKEIIPNILECIIRGELDILKDWCHERAYIRLAKKIKKGHTPSRILDINDVDLAKCEMLEQGPVLVITFQCQEIDAIRDDRGNIVKKDDEVLRTRYAWALCRDQNELEPKAAWKLLDISDSRTDTWFDE